MWFHVQTTSYYDFCATVAWWSTFILCGYDEKSQRTVFYVVFFKYKAKNELRFKILNKILRRREYFPIKNKRMFLR